MVDEIFDFGFTLVDEEELEAVQVQSVTLNQTEKTLVDAQDKLDRLYNAIQPLLNNLKALPEKEYIKWPDRSAKVEAFSDYIDTIYHQS